MDFKKKKLAEMPHYNCSKIIKNLGINLTEEVKDLYNEHFKTLKKETKEDTRWWRDLPCFWIDRISIMKMVVLPKLIYRFNAVPIRIPMSYFTVLEKIILRQMEPHTQKKPQNM